MKNKNFWILLLLLLAGIVFGGFLGVILVEFWTILWAGYPTGFKSRASGHYLWPDDPHYDGKYHRCGGCTFDLPLFIKIQVLHCRNQK